jgi:hypothetical protein
MVEEPLNGRDKVFHPKWLALKRIESGVRNLLPVCGHHGRGHGHVESVHYHRLRDLGDRRRHPTGLEGLHAHRGVPVRSGV